MRCLGLYIKALRLQCTPGHPALQASNISLPHPIPIQPPMDITSDNHPKKQVRRPVANSWLNKVLFQGTKMADNLIIHNAIIMKPPKKSLFYLYIYGFCWHFANRILRKKSFLQLFPPTHPKANPKPNRKTPGGPVNRTPRGILAPTLTKRSGASPLHVSLRRVGNGPMENHRFL